MKTLFGISTLSLGLLLLVGCASTQKTTYNDPLPQQQSVGSSVVDGRYVALVEHIAKKRGTRVMWVNLPQKPVRGTVAVVE